MKRKNFSIHIEAYGRFRLTPLYDIISIYPFIGGTDPNIRDLKVAMSLRGTDGKEWKVFQIFRRHFLEAAKAAEFSVTRMDEIISNMCAQVDDVIERVQNDLPKNFPAHVSIPIFNGMKERKSRLMINA